MNERRNPLPPPSTSIPLSEGLFFGLDIQILICDALECNREAQNLLHSGLCNDWRMESSWAKYN